MAENAETTGPSLPRAPIDRVVEPVVRFLHVDCNLHHWSTNGLNNCPHHSSRVKPAVIARPPKAVKFHTISSGPSRTASAG